MDAEDSKLFLLDPKNWHQNEVFPIPKKLAVGLEELPV